MLPALPAPPVMVLEQLLAAGHEAALVGGGLRDTLRGETPLDWDVATSAPPDVVAGLFPGSTWENRFGTVTVHGEVDVEVTTYRSESGYRDRRRPDEVRWGTSLADDLARRDFTINAIAWVPDDLAALRGRLLDPYGGIADLRDGVLRSVGDPRLRFDEDALRLLRAVRFATRFEMRLEPATEAAIRLLAPTATTISGERIRDELLRLISLPVPSRAFGLLEDLGLLMVILPELAALRGVPQAKAIPGDALDHSLRAVDAAPQQLRLAALLHDIGKASTLADGHFYGHETVGADLAEAALRCLRFPVAVTRDVAHLVREHMFDYSSDWTDAAVRRFIRRVGVAQLGPLVALRHADNAASGATEPAHGGLPELERRIAVELAASPQPGRLAIDGHVLQRELGLAPGPVIGRLLYRLTEAVLDDPTCNERDALLGIARATLTSGARAQRGG